MDRLISQFEVIRAIEKYVDNIFTKNMGDLINDIKAIPSPQPKTGQFAKWVATEIFDDMWKYNKDSFAEIACRKLEKLGIVRAKGDEWELVEPTCDTCQYTTAAFNPCNACKDKSEYKPQERSE